MTVNLPQWLQEHVSLQPLNTLGLPATARYFTSVTTIDELVDALQWARQQGLAVLPLGGGSNVVLAGDYAGLVIQIGIQGRTIATENDHLLVQAGAGENWHGFVAWTVEQGCYGLENLSLIPGTVGAAPIQNIGAYGVEIKDRFYALEAVDVVTGERVVFDKNQCQFGYRDSVFKGELRDRFIIVSVTFALSQTFTPVLDYGHLRDQVEQQAKQQPLTAALVSAVVDRIRSEKLPNPQLVGNAGSFFKNPQIADAHYQGLRQCEPNLVAFPANDNHWKLAAGWLIERCGFKGVERDGGAGVYPHQALVLINRGGATGADILALAKEIQLAVHGRFDVMLEIEPRIYG